MKGSIKLGGENVLTVELDDATGKVAVKGRGKIREFWDWVMEDYQDFTFWDTYGDKQLLLPVRADTFHEVLRVVATTASNQTGDNYDYDGWVGEQEIVVPVEDTIA